MFDETWFPARLDKHVPNACTALPGNTTSQSYHSDLTAADLRPSSPTTSATPHPSFSFPPLQPPGSVHILQPHGSVPQHTTSLILSPLPTSTHTTAPLTPLSNVEFQNLQLHGRLLGHKDSDVPHGEHQNGSILGHKEADIHHGDSHQDATTSPTEAHDPGDSEARILLQDIKRRTLTCASHSTCSLPRNPSGKVTAIRNTHLPLPLLPLSHPPSIP